jgi:hypothetical protein
VEWAQANETPPGFAQGDVGGDDLYDVSPPADFVEVVAATGHSHYLCLLVLPPHIFHLRAAHAG